VSTGRVLVVCGVAGSGKSTVGQAVATELGVTFIDADDYHSRQARAQMQRGDPLSEPDRLRWLRRVAAAAGAARPCVLACSALGRRHRDLLRSIGEVDIVLLEVGVGELVRRLAGRRDHFAGPALLSSQLATFEPPGPGERVWTVDGSAPQEECVAAILWLVSRQHTEPPPSR
jgi:gluconokinase